MAGAAGGANAYDLGLGIEAQARQARYQAFARTLLPCEVLVTAQHLDDQCETFLLALKRGSGPAGLSAMAEVSEFAGTRLIRPLLARTRGELVQWALAHGSLDKTKVIRAALVRSSNFWPGRSAVIAAALAAFCETTARSAALCAEQESLLDELLADDLAHCQSPQGTLQIVPMLAMSDARRAAIIRRWLAGQNAPMPSRDALVRIWQEVALARKSAPCLRLGAFEIRRYQSQLWWIKSVTGQSENIVPWQTWLQPLELPAGLGSVQLNAGGAIRPPRARRSGQRAFQSARIAAYCRA